MAWGLLAVHSPLPVLVAFAVAASLLLVGCGYCIAKGVHGKPASPRHPVNKGFLLVAMLEAAGVAGAIFAAQKMGRLDALPAAVGLVIGLHFFALAKVFRAPVYNVTAIAITFWCVASWLLFRGNSMTVSASLGIGAILWTTSSYNLFRVLAGSTAG